MCPNLKDKKSLLHGNTDQVDSGDANQKLNFWLGKPSQISH